MRGRVGDEKVADGSASSSAKGLWFGSTLGSVTDLFKRQETVCLFTGSLSRVVERSQLSVVAIFLGVKPCLRLNSSKRC
jgi:hypothetical protein